jgi:hypothetical protein
MGLLYLYTRTHTHTHTYIFCIYIYCNYAILHITKNYFQQMLMIFIHRNTDDANLTVFWYFLFLNRALRRDEPTKCTELYTRTSFFFTMVPTCFDKTMQSSGSDCVPFWATSDLPPKMHGAHQVTRHNKPIHNILSTAAQLSISHKALGTLPKCVETCSSCHT